LGKKWPTFPLGERGLKKGNYLKTFPGKKRFLKWEAINFKGNSLKKGYKERGIFQKN